MRTLLLATAALACSVASAQYSGGCTSSSSWDFLMLVSQWPPSACQQYGGCQNGTVSTTYFTLHGLWPQNNDGSYPCTCSNEQFDENDVKNLLTSMDKYWPSYNGANSDFWSHEWSKHGTCAESDSVIGSQALYFAGALSLRSKYPVDGALQAAGITPSDSKRYSVSSIHNAIQAATGAAATLTCSNSGVLQAVSLCIDSGLNVIDCQSPGASDACNSDTVLIPVSLNFKAESPALRGSA